MMARGWLVAMALRPIAEEILQIEESLVVQEDNANVLGGERGSTPST